MYEYVGTYVSLPMVVFRNNRHVYSGADTNGLYSLMCMFIVLRNACNQRQRAFEVKYFNVSTTPASYRCNIMH